MAIVVLVLWLFTAAAGFCLLVTSNLRHTGPVSPPRPAPPAVPAAVSAASADPAAPGSAAQPASRRELKRARHEQFDPPSLIAARKAPMMPGARSLLEFAHPACGIIGLAFWLGFTLVHNRVLGWIAVGLVAATACAGLAWFTANVRTASARTATALAASGQTDREDSAPSFNGRLIAVHGGAATLTIVAAVLSAVILHG
jgi:hypothetical protein